MIGLRDALPRAWLQTTPHRRSSSTAPSERLPSEASAAGPPRTRTTQPARALRPARAAQLMAAACISLSTCLLAPATGTRAQSDDPQPSIDDIYRDEREPNDAPTPAATKPMPSTALEGTLARYAHEPSVERVVAAALRFAQRSPQQFADMSARARLRGIIPHLDLGVRRGQGIDLRWTPADDIAGNRATADDITLFATLRFDLDRLLFTGEEVSIAREARFAHDARYALVRKVVHVYFLRRRLQLERDMLGGTSIAQLVRIQETEALLDAFTDGAWKRMLESARTSWKTGAGTNASARP